MIRLRIAKLTGILLFAGIMHLSAAIAGQRLSITITNSPLNKVFAEIEKKTNYVFFYDAAILEHSKPVTVDIKEATVEEALHAVLRGQGLEYSIQDRTIFIRREALKQAPPATAPSAQENGNPPLVTGVVKASDGSPLAGATIFIPRLNRSVITNARGEFEFKDIPDGDYLVEVSFVGYQLHRQMLKVIGHSGSVQVEMKPAGGQLDEVVTKGYYSTSNRLNTGNVTVVKGEDIQKQAVSDPLLALEGRVPGLYISQTSGIPGAYSSVLLRGQNSIPNAISKLMTANDPLYIVDGVPYSSASMTNSYVGGGAVGSSIIGQGFPVGGLSPFNNLDPSIIESIEILKDADATAIYGSRGANGVILITTKKGKANQTRFSVNVFSGIGQVAHRLQLLNTPQYLQMRHEALRNDGLKPNPVVDYDLIGAWDTTRYTDWQKVLIGNKANYSGAQLNFSGGDNNTQFQVGGSFGDQGMVFPGSFGDKKTAVHLSLTHFSPDKKFQLLASAQYVYDDNNMPNTNITSKILIAPDAPPLYDRFGNINWAPVGGNIATWTNPLAYLPETNITKTTNLIGSLNIGYQVFPGLTIKANLGFTSTQAIQNRLEPSASFAPIINVAALRTNYFGTNDLRSWIAEPQIDYKLRLGKASFDLLGGSTFQENNSSTIGQAASNFVSDALITNPAAAASLQLEGYQGVQYHYNAFFGRLGFTWDDKYLVNITGRRDGSSRFGHGNQFGNFGALGTGWIFSKEAFAQRALPILSFGKLRASYGTTGNDQIADYQYLSTYTSVSTAYQSTTALNPTNLANPAIAWERVNKLEGGMELGFFHDRLLISASWYRNQTKNQLVGYPLPLITGFSSVQFNLPATIQNDGLELGINASVFRNGKFSWNSSFNFSMPRNKLVAFPNLQNYASYTNYTVGHSLFSRHIYQYTGVNEQTGLYGFSTKNLGGVPSLKTDYVVSKPLTQIYYGGYLNSFRYKRLQLDILFQFVKQWKFSYMNGENSMPGVFNVNQPIDVLGRWQSAGQNTNIERFGTRSPASSFYTIMQISSGAIVDGSFVRLKNISLSYDLPSLWKQRMHLHEGRIYFQAQNLLTLTNYKGLDPETQGFSLPPLRMMTAGIQFGF